MKPGVMRQILSRACDIASVSNLEPLWQGVWVRSPSVAQLGAADGALQTLLAALVLLNADCQIALPTLELESVRHGLVLQHLS